MKALDLVNFLKTPADRDVIKRWTIPAGPGAYRLELAQPPDPRRYSFLVLGDTGDSAGIRAPVSPQDAVGLHLAEDAALPGSNGEGRFVIHTGDVVYMAGERRLYDRNFRRPYAPFLTPESTVDNLVFRQPFLPVPGNHDYYDFSGWATTLAATPFLGAGVKALARELFAFEIPTGGSDMGGAYMQAFIDPKMESERRAYQPGEYTRLPNRYYRFRMGEVDFFALDSNTLESPPPSVDLAEERKSAQRHVEELETQAKALRQQLVRDEQAVERWMALRRQEAAREPDRLAVARGVSVAMGTALERLEAALAEAPEHPSPSSEMLKQARDLRQRWEKAHSAVVNGARVRAVEASLEALEEVVDTCAELLLALEGCLGELPEGPQRTQLLAAQEAVTRATRAWREEVTGLPPGDLCARLKRLSASALEVQRDLARERRRMGRQPDDYDAAQLEWLKASLEESVRERPDGWRVVYLHQPLYTTIGNHSENSDVAGVRENLIPLLRDHVHLVLAGHSHAFEWFRSSALPTTALVVTGGGGQPWLWRSILDPKRFRRYRNLYRLLCAGGATECVLAGRGPAAADGEDGELYHYVRVEVTPEALLVRPVGVRRLASGFRREDPMPVFHVPELSGEEPLERPTWTPRLLQAIEIRRRKPPRLRWG